MNSKIYRCGWCGYPTDKDGNCLRNDAFRKVSDMLLNYETSMHETHVDGECCPYGGGREPERMRVTRDMAIDAQDPSLEGEYI